MKLREALDRVEKMSQGDVIFARKPWTLESDAEIGTLDPDLRVPASVTARGFDYFLESSIANEALEVFGAYEATIGERRAMLLFYAENDAYPEWVYER